jgi:hypothetical protein
MAFRLYCGLLVLALGVGRLWRVGVLFCEGGEVEWLRSIGSLEWVREVEVVRELLELEFGVIVYMIGIRSIVIVAI